MYIKLKNSVPENYTIGKLRRDNPDISFPNTISKEILEKFDIFLYTQEEQPSIEEKTQKIEDGGFVKDENGNWTKTWNIIQKTQEEIESWISIKQSQIRYNRNKLLTETDFYALSDVTMSPEMASYRQSLRDITSQDGFPENIIWPVKPV